MSTSVSSFANFDALNLPTEERAMIQSGVDAVQSVEGGWEFLRTYDPPVDQGFMFSTPPPMQLKIDAEISRRYGGHSGASYGWTMRVLQSIAKYGWTQYAKRMLDTHGPPPSLIAKTLEQAATVESFLGTLPVPSDLTQFATAIQNDSGMRKMIPDLDEQADTLKRFAEGTMSYAEMRSKCG